MTEKDVEEAQVVNEQNVAENAEVAEQQETKQELNFKALREEKDKVARERDAYLKEIQSLKSQQSQNKSFFDGDPQDWPTKHEVDANFKKFGSDVMSQVQKALVEVKYPNAHELITKYGNEVPVKVANIIAQSGDLEAAIEAVKLTPSYLRDHAQEHINVAKAMENASKPKSTLNASSKGSVSKDSRFKSMSREERMTLMDRFTRGYSA